MSPVMCCKFECEREAAWDVVLYFDWPSHKVGVSAVCEHHLQVEEPVWEHWRLHHLYGFVGYSIAPITRGRSLKF